MNSRQYLDLLIKIQTNFLDFIDSETNDEEKYENLITLIKDQKIDDDQHTLSLLLHLLISIADHHRGPNFFSKIEKILAYLKGSIKKYFSDFTIFNLFKKSKRLLLFLFEEKIITIDKHMVEKIKNEDYFIPEIQPFKNSEKTIPDNYNELRKIGENDSTICELIRKDKIREFIAYVNRNNINLSKTKIKSSIYETNSLLVNNDSLMKYAAFFGSLQIIKYLVNEGIELDQCMWSYAIYSQNSELIKFLEDNDVKPFKIPNYNNEYEFLVEIAIKCHHNDIANYFLVNFLHKENKDEEKKYAENIFNLGVKYYNFSFIKNDLIDEVSFVQFCSYDYYVFAEMLLKTKNININDNTIFLI